MAIRIILAEDGYLIREGLVAVLSKVQDLELVAVCEDFDTLLAAVDTNSCDIVITDIRMPPSGTNEGIVAAARLRESHPDLGVLVLTQFPDAEYALALFEQDAHRRGFLLKERISDPERLVSAIREVAAGGSVVDPKVVDSLVRARTGQRGSTLDRLTPREREVLSEMAQGANNNTIARSLVLSEKAIEKHINSIFSKLGLSEEADVNKRVKAVLMLLSEPG
ncbi:MAG: response regulator transcription factor [Actinomycetota bacterium]